MTRSLHSTIVNNILRKGKKNLAEKIYLSSLDETKKMFRRKNAQSTVVTGLGMIQPKVSIINKKKAGSIVKIPRPYWDTENLSKSVKWVVNSSKTYSLKSTAESIAQELSRSLSKTSVSYKKKIQIHKSAVQNRGNIK